MLGQTWFGSRFGLVFGDSVGSRFGFWGQTNGSVGSRFCFNGITLKIHPFFAILLSKVRGSDRFLGGSVGSRFGFQEQTGGSVGSRFGFWRFGRFEVREVRGSEGSRFGRFEVRCFQVRPNTSSIQY